MNKRQFTVTVQVDVYDSRATIARAYEIARWRGGKLRNLTLPEAVQYLYDVGSVEDSGSEIVESSVSEDRGNV
jgi:hypothetical protein